MKLWLVLDCAKKAWESVMLRDLAAVAGDSSSASGEFNNPPVSTLCNL